MFVRAYLRASTNEQDAARARAQLETFAADHGLHIAAFYAENESGAKLARPELFRLLSDAKRGDILLIEQVDRLSRLTATDWECLKGELATRHIRVVAPDLPTSWVMTTAKADDFTARMFDAINGMMLDVDHPNTIHGLHFTVAIPFADACHASPRRRRRRRRAPQAG